MKHVIFTLGMTQKDVKQRSLSSWLLSVFRISATRWMKIFELCINTKTLNQGYEK